MVKDVRLVRAARPEPLTTVRKPLAVKLLMVTTVRLTNGHACRALPLPRVPVSYR
jgi:hypothetical protein